MDFQQGTFVKLRVTSKVHLGAFQVDLPEGAIVEFDGQTVHYGGASYNVPAVRGAVTAGWLVPEDDNVSRYIPKPAGVHVRPATPGAKGDKEPMMVETTSDEEEVVGNYETQMDDRREAARVAASTTPQKLPAKAVTVSQPDPLPVEVEYPSEPEEGGMQVVSGDDQEAVPVARFGTPAVQKNKFNSVSEMAQEAAKLDSSGRTVKVQKLAHARPSATQAEGEDINARTGGATGDVSEAKSGDDLEEILPDALSTGRPQAFSWDKSGHWRKRVEKALEYADKPDVLRQILEVETASVVGHLKSELARRGISLSS